MPCTVLKLGEPKKNQSGPYRQKITSNYENHQSDCMTTGTVVPKSWINFNLMHPGYHSRHDITLRVHVDKPFNVVLC